MSKRFFLVSVLTCIVILLIPITTLSIVSEEIEHQLLLFEKDTFSIRWTHSVEKEEWEEFFLIRDHEIELYGTRFKTFGAGVPSNFENTFIKDGWVYMMDINRKIDEFNLQAGKDTGHELHIKGETIHLSLEDITVSYKIEIQKKPLFLYLLAKISTGV
jgi:hypothetical protein